MKNISNDFVTIEYNNSQKEIAEYCIDIFNGEPELYKGLLNGKTFIRSDELPIICLIDNDEGTKEFNKAYINQAIMKMNGVSDKWYPFDDKTNSDIYDYIMKYIYGKPNSSWIKSIGMHLAYDYFKRTKDFEYLNNYLYGDGITDDDIMDMCVFYVTDCYDELLREKIHKDVQLLSKDESITKNFNGIMSILMDVANNILMDVANNISSRINNKNISPEELYKKVRKNPIPQIDDKQFEVLVRGALTYIDPTNELLDEYLKCRRENKIEEKKVVNGNEVSYFHKNKKNYGIKLYKYGDLTDVINLVHEFGHLHYMNKNNQDKNTLFDEYPSIYFELKTAEYLSTVGYSEENIYYTTLFRSYSNTYNITYLVPIIVSANINMGKEKEDYDLGPIKRMVDMYDERIDTSYLETICTKEEIEELTAQLEAQAMQIKWLMLKQETNLSEILQYIVGTYLAEDAINNIEHEDVLEILDTITQGEHSLNDVLKIQGLIPSSNQEDKPKQKEKIDDKDNKETSE